MLKCNDCDYEFDEPDIVEEHHPYGMRCAVEYLAVCPRCGNNDFDENNEKEDEEEC